MLSRGLLREFLVNMRAGIGPQDLAQHNSGVGRRRKLKGKLHRQVSVSYTHLTLPTICSV